MSTYRTVEARVWEVEQVETDLCAGCVNFIIAYPGRLMQTMRSGETGDRAAAVESFETAAAGYSQLNADRDAIVHEAEVDGCERFAADSASALLAALDYAFPGCATAAGEGGCIVKPWREVLAEKGWKHDEDCRWSESWVIEFNGERWEFMMHPGVGGALASVWRDGGGSCFEELDDDDVCTTEDVAFAALMAKPIGPGRVTVGALLGVEV